MADKVLMIIGSRKVIMRAEEMTKDLIDYEMVCNGRIYGSETNLCSAPMSAQFSRRNNCCIGFTEALRVDHPHTFGCENSRKSKYRCVSGLDYSGGRHKKEDFLECMFSVEGKKRKRPTGPYEIDDTDLNDVPDTLNGDTPKELKRKTQHPTSFKQLVQLLQYLTISHRYMGRSVYDWIVDFRSLKNHQKYGMLDEEMIIICKLCNNRDLNFVVGESDWILADCTYDGNSENASSHWFFKLNCSFKTLKKMKAYSSREDRYDYLIAVCSVWKKDTEYNNLLVSEPLSENRVVYIERKYFKT